MLLPLLLTVNVISSTRSMPSSWRGWCRWSAAVAGEQSVPDFSNHSCCCWCCCADRDSRIRLSLPSSAAVAAATAGGGSRRWGGRGSWSGWSRVDPAPADPWHRWVKREPGIRTRSWGPRVGELSCWRRRKKKDFERVSKKRMWVHQQTDPLSLALLGKKMGDLGLQDRLIRTIAAEQSSNYEIFQWITCSPAFGLWNGVGFFFCSRRYGRERRRERERERERERCEWVRACHGETLWEIVIIIIIIISGSSMYDGNEKEGIIAGKRWQQAKGKKRKGNQEQEKRGEDGKLDKRLVNYIVRKKDMEGGKLFGAREEGEREKGICLHHLLDARRFPILPFFPYLTSKQVLRIIEKELVPLQKKMQKERERESNSNKDCKQTNKKWERKSFLFLV